MTVPARARLRRPEVVEAIQWTGDNTADVMAFLGQEYSGGHYSSIIVGPGAFMGVSDYVIKRADEFRVLPEDWFAATYEPVEADHA